MANDRKCTIHVLKDKGNYPTFFHALLNNIQQYIYAKTPSKCKKCQSVAFA